MESGSAGEPVIVLAVGSERAVQELRRILGHSRWTLLEADSVAQAAAILRERPSVVLICEAVLADGTWKELLDHTLAFDPPPPLMVTATHADDRLWMEVLNCGGYNVLAQPLNERELFDSVSLAWRHRKDRPPLRLGATGS